MSNYNKEIMLNELDQSKFELTQPNQYNNNFYGAIENDGKGLFRSSDFVIYGSNLKQVDNFPIQTIRISDNALNKLLKQIDNYMDTDDVRSHLCEQTNSDQLRYRPLVRDYINKNGEEASSSELRLIQIKDNQGTKEKYKYRTIFFDENDDELKPKTLDELREVVGYRSNVKVKFVADYQVKPEKGEYCVLLKIKYIQIKKDSTDRPEVDPELLALKVNDVDLETLNQRVTFLQAPKEMTEKQKFVRVEIDGKPGKRLRLDNITLEKEDPEVYVGLVPESYESNKITLILKDGNLKFFQGLDSTFQQKLSEIRELLDLKKKDKLEYVPIVRQDTNLPTCRFAIDLSSDKKTKFYVDNKLLEYESIDDLRPYLGLGITLKNLNVCIRKLPYIQAKKELYVNIKINSCTIVPSASTSNRKEYVNSGKFNQETTISDDLC